MPRETKVTSKYQTSIPKEVRKILNIRPGEKVEWDVVKSMVIVSSKPKVKDPVKALTSQIKGTLNLDAVKLVREIRDEME